MKKLSAPVKVGIVGYGPFFDMGKLHGNAVAAAEGLELEAVCDINEERLAVARKDFEGIKTYSDVEELAADPEIGLAVVATPHNVHLSCALSCLEAGKCVVVEKPMALTAAECTQMIEAAQNAGVTLSVFHNRRRDGEFLTTKDAIEKGCIGDVFHLEAHSGGYDRPSDWWRSEKEISGGLFYDWGAHFLDWVLNLIPGRIRKVSGQFQKRVWDHVTNEDHVEAYMKFDGDAVAHVQLSTIAACGKPRFYILGTNGAIVDRGEGHIEVFTRLHGYTAQFDVKYYETDWEGYYRDLAAHLLEGKPNPITPESARRVIAVMEAAEISSKTGCEQEVPYEQDWTP